MPTSQTAASEPHGTPTLRENAITRLRAGKNPFALSVATAGTQDSCCEYNVQGLVDSQRSDLLAIIDLYRQPHQPSQVFPILGDTGSGKTHLLTMVQAELQQEAVQRGRESLLVVADHYSLKVDAVDFFFWQIINHLLASKAPGSRLIQVISKRVTARLLTEALRELPPHQQAQLIPVRGLWERIKNWFGSSAGTRDRLDRLRDLIVRCDLPTGVEPQVACEEAGFPVTKAMALINAHLQRVESNDVAGVLRREFYSRLAAFALLREFDPLQDYLTDGFREGPDHIKMAGQLTRRMLTVVLELCRTLAIPVMLVFDQLEDYLSTPASAQATEVFNTFSRGLAALVNNVPGLGVLVFAERGLWNMMIGAESVKYIRDRLDQEFNLPGRPTQRAVVIPDRIPRPFLVELVERRMRSALGDFNSTGLPPQFPFEEAHLRELEDELTIRACLRKLSRWFNAIVVPTSPPPIAPPLPVPPVSVPPAPQPSVSETKPAPPLVDAKLMQLLRLRWETELAGARKTVSGGGARAALIPKVQSALHYWLLHLKEQGILSAAGWTKVELIEETKKGIYGYLTVIRTKDPDAPGVGIAAWLAVGSGRPKELRCRLEFFDKVPCPIRTLALFRQDGIGALNGDTKEIYDAAKKLGRDVRVQACEQKHLEALLAFPSWLPAVSGEINAAGPNGVLTLKEFVAKLSKELLNWIDSWC